MQEASAQWSLQGSCPVRVVCDSQQVRMGYAPMAQLPRLAAWLPTDQPDASLAYELRFYRDEARALLASVRVEGVAQMPCSRCLAPMIVPLIGQSVVQFVHSEAQAEQVADDREPVLLDADGQVSLLELIEEEAIMALPVVAMHETQCAPPWHETVESRPAADESKAENPFSALVGRLGVAKTGQGADQ